MAIFSQKTPSPKKKTSSDKPKGKSRSGVADKGSRSTSKKTGSASKSSTRKKSSSSQTRVTTGRRKAVAAAKQPFWQAAGAALLVAGIVFGLAWLVLSSSVPSSSPVASQSSRSQKNVATLNTKQSKAPSQGKGQSTPSASYLSKNAEKATQQAKNAKELADAKAKAEAEAALWAEKVRQQESNKQSAALEGNDGAASRVASTTNAPTSPTPSVAPSLAESNNKAGTSSPRLGAGAGAGAGSEEDSSPTLLPEVARALAELQNLPFEELDETHLQEQIQEIDATLIQAVDAVGIATSAVRPGNVEIKRKGEDVYFFQQIEILSREKSATLVALLEQLLEPLGANLTQGADNIWEVSVGKTPTHRLILYSHQNQFPEEVSSGAERKLRASGEPAYLVIVIDDLGMSMDHVRRLARLPYPVTFAFWPHGTHAKEGATYAHNRGKEILVHIPMEPITYPRTTPGPNALLNTLSVSQIEQRVTKALDAVPYAVGANNHMGSRFTQNRAGVRAVLGVLESRGYMVLDSVTHPRSVFYAEAKKRPLRSFERQVFLDHKKSLPLILAQLQEAQRVALRYGQAIAIGHPLPETLQALEMWQQRRNTTVQIIRLQDLPRRQ